MNKSDLKRNYQMIEHGRFARRGYDWWWHNFTATDDQTGEERSFFIEYYTCNPKLKNQFADGRAVLGQLDENREKKLRPSYVMIKAGWWGKDAAQIHRFIPWKNTRIAKTPCDGFLFQAEDCTAGETRLTGSVDVSEADAKNHAEFMCNSGSITESESHITWFVRQKTLRHVMETEIRCQKSDMLLINYESPDGLKRHRRLWNGGTGSGTVKLYRRTVKGPVLIDEVLAGHVGCEYGEYSDE